MRGNGVNAMLHQFVIAGYPIELAI